MLREPLPNNTYHTVLDMPRRAHKMLALPTSSVAESSSSSSTTAAAVKRRRGVLVRVACNSCRKHKLACDGQRPTCSRCAGKAAVCAYDTENADESRYVAAKREVKRLQQENEQLRVAIASMRQKPPGHADAILDNSSLLDKASDAFLQSSLSPLKMYISVLGPVESLLEVELAVLHEKMFPNLIPIANSQALAEELFSDQHKTNAYEKLSSCSLTSVGSALGARFCDPRLCQLRLHYWTSAAIPNTLAAAIISIYLEQHHPVIACFDAGLFVQDLVQHQHDYCSSALVNAVLILGCQTLAAFDVRLYEVERHLQDELDSLLIDADTTEDITTIAALVVHAWSSSINARDDLAMLARTRSHAAVRRIGTMPASPYASAFDMVDTDRYMAHVVWGHFLDVTLFDFFYERWTPISPPTYPIPGSAGFPLQEYVGSTFAMTCELIFMMHGFVKLYYAPQALSQLSTDLHNTVEQKYGALLRWSDGLPSIFLRNEYCSMNTFVIHIWFHNLVISMMRPWKGMGVMFHGSTSTGATPESISAASIRQLKSIVLTVMVSHPQAYINASWHTALYAIANAAIADSQAPESAFFFRLALIGYMRLGLIYRFARLCVLGLLQMGLTAGLISLAEATLVIRSIEKLDEQRSDVSQDILKFPLQVNTPSKAQDYYSNTASSLVHELRAANIIQDQEDLS